MFDTVVYYAKYEYHPDTSEVNLILKAQLKSTLVLILRLSVLRFDLS